MPANRLFLVTVVEPNPCCRESRGISDDSSPSRGSLPRDVSVCGRHEVFQTLAPCRERRARSESNWPGALFTPSRRHRSSTRDRAKLKSSAHSIAIRSNLSCCTSTRFRVSGEHAASTRKTRVPRGSSHLTPEIETSRRSCPQSVEGQKSKEGTSLAPLGTVRADRRARTRTIRAPDVSIKPRELCL